MNIVTPENPIAFTWSPAPRYWRSPTPSEQLYDIMHILRKLKYSTKGLISYELNKNGNIHVHGCLYITDKIQWYKTTLPLFKRNGYVVVKEVFKLDTWTQYMNKDIEQMKKILNTQALPVDVKKLKKQKLYVTKKDEIDNGILNYIISEKYIETKYPAQEKEASEEHNESRQ